eukprot:10103376-Lingulodinium_polyedra.AAC.1
MVAARGPAAWSGDFAIYGRRCPRLLQRGGASVCAEPKCPRLRAGPPVACSAFLAQRVAGRVGVPP